MKFFDKFKKKEEVDEDQITCFKKKDKSIVFISTLNKAHPKLANALKITLFCLLPISLIVTGSYLGIKEMQNKDDNPFSNVVEISEDTITRRIYLISEDNDTVPLTININKVNSLHEEILMLFNLLKVDSKITSSTFKGVIPSSTRLVSFTLEDGLLSLNLSKEILEYEETISKEKLLDSITYTMIQFDQVDEISLFVEDELLVSSLSSSRGINVDKSYTISSIANKRLMTYFYEKEFDNKSYYLPKSIYVNDLNGDNVAFVEGSKYIPSASSGYKRLSLYKQLASKQNPSEEFELIVNESALIEESLINKSLYDMILLSLDMMNINKRVSFIYEGEEIKVDSIIDEKSYSVSSIVYNEVEAI